MANYVDEYIAEMKEMRHECYVTGLLENISDLLADGEPNLRTELLNIIVADIEGELEDMQYDPTKIALRMKLRCVVKGLSHARVFSNEFDKVKKYYNDEQLELF